MDDELMVFDALDEGVITEVIRPAAILLETSARTVLVELAVRDVRAGGLWYATPSLWQRYDQPWSAVNDAGSARLLGSLQVAYGTPTRYEITIYRCTITQAGAEQGFDVRALANEALGFGGLDLDRCPRATLNMPPQRFPMR